MKKLDIRTLVLMGLFIAMSFIGAMIKITGYSIALDALPAFFAAVFLGPVYGGLVGLLGHLFTSGMAGFYLSLPVHITIALMMFVACYGFGWVYSLNKKTTTKIAGIATGIFLNGPVSLGVTALILSFSIGMEGAKGMFLAMFLPLLIGASVNVILGSVIYELVKDKTKYL